MLLRKLTQPRYCFLFLLALSIVVRVGASLTVVGISSEVASLDLDEQEYYNLASDLLQGQYEFNARRTLGHIVVLALYRWLTFDNLFLTQVLATVIFSLTAPLMYLLTRRITGNSMAGAIVGLLVVFWIPYVYYGTSLYSETTALPLLVCFLLLLPLGSIFKGNQERSDRSQENLQANSRENWLRYGLSGVLLAIVMLIRPMYLLFLPFVLLLIFLEEPRWRTALKRSIVLLIGCSLLVLPWSVYMSTNAGTPILISANGGETLGGGLNPTLVEQGYQVKTAPDGRVTWTGPGKWLNPWETGYLNAAELKLSYQEQDKLLRQRTVAWVLAHPREALSLQAAKLFYMWGFYPLQWDKQTLLGSVPTAIALLLSLGGMIRFRQYTRHLARFWLLPVFVSAIALVSWGSWRFRQPGDLGVLAMSTLFVLSFVVLPEKLVRGAKVPDVPVVNGIPAPVQE
ncbi:hypothetical protein [Leptolyngbya ohadii]|uniref:hypothetical protein n=1 Tax=Leptolyngbya ohadii TaxID=1962290 RepID=UPI000B59CF02|nr:hypothetical protein [Leptolyngbya ohadii]